MNNMTTIIEGILTSYRKPTKLPQKRILKLKLILYILIFVKKIV